MTLEVKRNQLVFYYKFYSVIVKRGDIEKIAIFYRKDILVTTLDWIMGRNFEEVRSPGAIINKRIRNEYDVLLKIQVSKKQVKTKYGILGKLTYWLNPIIIFNNVLVAPKNNYHTTTSVLGRPQIFEALNNLKNNDYNVGRQLEIFNTIFDKPVVADIFDKAIIKYSTKFLLGIFILIIVALAILVLFGK